MVEKNKEYVVQVISQGYEGEGIAKINETELDEDVLNQSLTQLLLWGKQ